MVVDDGYDETCLKPRPQYTIRLSGEADENGNYATIIIGYEDSDIIKKRADDVYIFSSGIIIELPDINYWENEGLNNSNSAPGCTITLNPSLHFEDRINMGVLRELKRKLDGIITKQRGKELSGVLQLGINKGLPENVDSKIGAFLTGKNGSTKAQMNKLKQNMGIQGAPRAGGTRRRSKHSR